ncbi:hypothetical protein BLA29_015405, partial [Euroglyphus maynei]
TGQQGRKPVAPLQVHSCVSGKAVEISLQRHSRSDAYRVGPRRSLSLPYAQARTRWSVRQSAPEPDRTSPPAPACTVRCACR